MSQRKIVCCRVHSSGVSMYWNTGHRTFTPFDKKVPKKPKRGFRQEVEKDKYTPEQNAAYRLAVYGLASVPPEELAVMHPRKIKKIKKRFIRSQKEINRMKNEILEKMLNQTMSAVFKESSSSNVVKIFNECYDDCYDEPNTLTFSFLGITKDMIVQRLLAAGILRTEIFKV